jgi:hypothetical protein
VTDDNPFFYSYFKLETLAYQSDCQGRLNCYPIGNIILLTLVTLAIVTAAIFIVLPLWRYQRAGLRTPHAGPMLAYFSLLGAGYIFVEIIFIQRFTLLIGYPTQAVTVTLFSMLTFSALGSLVGQRVLTTARHLRTLLVGLALLAVVYTFGLAPLAQSLLRLPDLARIVVSVLLIAPLAFLMGMPFPTGLKQLGVRAPGLVPWAWGMNGVFSVLGSSAVILVSMFSNFTWAMLGAALFYGAATLVAGALWKVDVAERVVAPLAAALRQSDAV